MIILGKDDGYFDDELIQPKKISKFTEDRQSVEEHWFGMPEFIQEESEAYTKIVFRFRNDKDLAEFEKLIGQPLTIKTKSAWYPSHTEWGQFANLRYIDGENDDNEE